MLGGDSTATQQKNANLKCCETTCDSKEKPDRANGKPLDCGIIIIGDEILKGHCKDTNAEFLLSHLWSNGVRVRKVSFISDNVDEIGDEVRQFSSKYSIVITAGGIGPTHDDVTFEGVAKAFNDTLVTNTEIERMVLQFGVNTSVAHKMATVPNSTILMIARDPVTKEAEQYPLLSVGNVYIFPGIPEYLVKLFSNHEEMFTSNCEFLLTKLYLSVEEAKIAHILDDVGKRFPAVHVGSYPVLHDSYRVKVTLETEIGESLEAAYSFLLEQLPTGCIISVKKCKPNTRDAMATQVADENKKSLEVRSRLLSCAPMSSLSLLDIEHFLSSKCKVPLGSAIKCAWSVLHQTLQSYSLDQVCIAFNGGKDCTVVLHLYVAYVKMMYPHHNEKLKALYLQADDSFDEAQHFIDACVANYNFDIVTIPGSVRAGLEKLSVLDADIKAIVMGQRRQDPYSADLRAFAMTDDDWPQYMRAFPILDWTYAEIWQFLRTLKLPYCSLYDAGYTSLGYRSKTEKNPKLRRDDGTYLPAYELKEEKLERAGREGMVKKT